MQTRRMLCLKKGAAKVYSLMKAAPLLIVIVVLVLVVVGCLIVVHEAAQVLEWMPVLAD